MKLIYFTRKDNFYVARALQERKFLGMIISRNIRDFELPLEKNEWFYKNSLKKVPFKKQKHLNKWLDDHQKFIEKR